ncbi:MAG: hypothetical protein GC159_20145 [Phycisphaera sp.]|nr:hypothetical protein [Phycisphaera sp.]
MNPKQRTQSVDLIINRALAQDDEFRRYSYSTSENIDQGILDFVFAAPGEPHMPEDVFDRLRWGGQLIYFSDNEADVKQAADVFSKRREFVVERVDMVEKRSFFSKLRVYFMMARKVRIVPPGDYSERFTYHVELQRHPKANNDYVVMKRLPDIEVVAKRLNLRHPDLSAEDVHKRASTFVNTIFPIFLTREAGILKVLEKYMPAQYHGRFPKVIDVEKNERGHITKLWMSMLRNTMPDNRPLNQLEFALQAVDLMRALHDQAHVIHLDLRLDNFIIGEKGVGFIDFGSAVRIGEDLSKSELLMQMFEQVMTTSQIQKTLGKMSQNGQVTSKVLQSGYRRVDKAVDLFFVALQINTPLKNPDFRFLVDMEQSKEMTGLISELTGEIFRPKDPHNPPFKTASDIFKGLKMIEDHLSKNGAVIRG